jgi:hypothetical protein
MKIDLAPETMEFAAAQAAHLVIPNLRFQEAGRERRPFEDEAFNLIWSPRIYGVDGRVVRKRSLRSAGPCTGLRQEPCIPPRLWYKPSCRVNDAILMTLEQGRPSETSVMPRKGPGGSSLPGFVSSFS